MTTTAGASASAVWWWCAAVALVFAAVGPGTVRADLPVHCLATQVAGEWVFELGDDNHDSSLRCGHKVPDTNLDHFTKDGFRLDVAEKLTVTLEEPSKATDEHGNEGSWTMVYDEGFEVVLGSRKFFAFSKYVPNSPAALKGDDIEDYTSVCGETLVGWYHNVDGSHWGCYHARQTKGEAADAGSGTRQRHYEHQLKHVVAPGSSFLALQPEAEDDPLFEHDMSFIETHNAQESSTWQAGVHRHFHGKRMSEMMKLLGRRHRRKSRSQQRAQRGHKAHAVQDERPDHVKYAGLPRNHDWRNVNGTNYDSPLRNQGNCGSCFAFAMTSAAESRLRVKSRGKDTTLLSTQAVVSCSILNQGCEGGYPYLVGKHAQEFGFVPEACMSYSGTDETCKLRASSGCPDPSDPVRYMASDYSYIGGFYGACNEADMMRALYEGGPIATAFDAPSSLFYYTGGVYTGASPPHEGPIMPGAVHDWEKTNHAVVLVGWGETVQGQKYWIAKNTWGEQWGEHGYFRILRGVDECGIESMAVTLDIELPEEQ